MNNIKIAKILVKIAKTFLDEPIKDSFIIKNKQLDKFLGYNGNLFYERSSAKSVIGMAEAKKLINQAIKAVGPGYTYQIFEFYDTPNRKVKKEIKM